MRDSDDLSTVTGHIPLNGRLVIFAVDGVIAPGDRALVIRNDGQFAVITVDAVDQSGPWMCAPMVSAQLTRDDPDFEEHLLYPNVAFAGRQMDDWHRRREAAIAAFDHGDVQISLSQVLVGRVIAERPLRGATQHSDAGAFDYASNHVHVG